MEDAALVRAARRFLEGKKELAVASKLVAVKKATLSLPIRQEGTVVEGRGQVQSWSVMELEEDEEEAQITPITRAKQHHLGLGTGATVQVEVKRLASGKAGKSNNDDNNNDDNNNDNNNGGGGGAELDGQVVQVGSQQDGSDGAEAGQSNSAT